MNSPEYVNAAELSLPEERIRYRVEFGGISAWHVIRETTFASSKEPGRWTRRAWDRRALCGALGATVVGGDAVGWPIEPELPNVGNVTCRRCLDRVDRMVVMAETRILPPADGRDPVAEFITAERALHADGCLYPEDDCTCDTSPEATP